MVTLASTKRTLLQLVGDACGEMGLPVPTQVIGNTDDQVIQLLALANREGKEFYQAGHRLGGWQELHTEYTFTTTSSGSLTGVTTSGSAIITGISSTSGIAANQLINCSSFSVRAYVVSVDSSTQVTMSESATVTSSSASMSFGTISYALPSDFAYFAQQTFWDGSYRWQLLGPIDAQEKNVIKWGISPVGPRRRFYIRGNLFYINPTPSTNGDTIAYDYYSNAWCQSSGGTGQQKWTADTDLYVLDDDCFVLGLQWRWKQKKGLDYTEELNDYEVAKGRIISRDGGNRPLPINAQSSDIRLLNSANTPDTGYGS